MRLLPREEKFYHLFLKQVAIISEASRLLLEGLRAGNSRLVGAATEINVLEHNGDEVIHELFTRLNSTFITPIDPEDIHALSSALDNVLDATLWPLEEQEAEARNKRRVGLGFTGLGNALTMMNLRYDTDPTEARRHSVPSILDPYLPYLHQRWTDGCRNGLQLWRELRAQGYPCSRKMVAVWVSQQRKLPGNTPAPTTPKKYLSKDGAEGTGKQVRLTAARWHRLHSPQARRFPSPISERGGRG